MNLDAVDFVNELPQSIRLGDCTEFVREADETNPIDEFHECLLQVLSYGNTQRLSDNDFLGNLLLIALVSAVENYIRSVTASTILICPIAQSHSAEKPVNFGAVLWHSGKRFGRSAFEHHSLADSKGVKNTLKDYLNIDLPQSVFSTLFAEYGKICQLRHGIVHANGFLPGKNALKLQIPRKHRVMEIVLRFKQLQDSAAVLNALVKTLNRHLFGEMCRRWAIDWRKRNDWVAADETRKFGNLWNLYLCQSERAKRPGRSKITMKACQAKVRQENSI